MHVGSLAVSGASLVIIEATAIQPEGRVTPYCLGLWNDAHEAALKRVIDFCHEQGGSALGIQLMHSGRKGSISAPWEGAAELAPKSGGWQTMAPSAVPFHGHALPPKALSRDDLAALKQVYVSAAERALRVGFDVVEMHSAHGYLLHSFLSPLSNFREDDYGGSLENRMRYPLEIFRALREVWPADKVLGVRISATDWAEGGWTLDDSVVYCRALRAAGCDYVAASSGGAANEQTIPVGPGYQLPLSERIRHEAAIPTVGVGLITKAQQAEDALVEGKADLIALGRGMIYNPRWAWHAAEQLGANSFFPKQYARSHPSMRTLGPLEYARLVREGRGTTGKG